MLDRARELLDEVRRRNPGARRSLLDDAFPKQRAFLDDTCRLKSALCTRRAGKSYGVGLYLFEGAFEKPGTSQLYLGLTRDSARRVMHKDVVRAIARRYGIRAQINKTTLEITLPNESVIYILGADASDEEREKILGQKFFKVAIDECASFRTDLHQLVYKVLRPAIVDLGGQIALIGTPGNVKNFFFDVTSGKVPGWSNHRWTAFDNPHIAEAWRAEMDELLAENPRVVETPWFKQMNLGEWVTDTSRLVYSGFDDARNGTDVVPADLLTGEWIFILGIDLGYTDATSLTLVAYHPSGDGTLYIVKSRKRTKLIVSQVADWIRKWQERFPIATMVVDNASKQVVEELIQRFQLPLEAAEKRDKAEAIAMFNSDMILGKVKVLRSHCAELIEEWGGLIWDEDEEPKKVEHPACPNHCADGALYAWRRATNYAARPDEEKPERGTEAASDDEDDASFAREERADWWEQ